MKHDKKPGFFRLLWELLYPFLAYQLISTVVSAVVAMLLISLNFGSYLGLNDPMKLMEAFSQLIVDYYGEISAVTAVLTLPLLIVLFRNDRKKEKAAAVYTAWEPLPAWAYITVFIMGAAACVGLNHLLIFSRLSELLQDSYESTAEILFQGKLIIEILVMGMLVPAVEELIFRGLAYRRMRWYIKPVPAMILSALYFAAVHGNWLQGIYAFIIGLLLAHAYEHTRSVFVPILIHSGANIVSVVISETAVFDRVYESDALFYIVTAAAIIIFAALFYLMVTYITPREKTQQSLGAYGQNE